MAFHLHYLGLPYSSTRVPGQTMPATGVPNWRKAPLPSPFRRNSAPFAPPFFGTFHPYTSKSASPEGRGFYTFMSFLLFRGKNPLGPAPRNFPPRLFLHYLGRFTIALQRPRSPLRRRRFPAPTYPQPGCNFPRCPTPCRYARCNSGRGFYPSGQSVSGPRNR